VSARPAVTGAARAALVALAGAGAACASGAPELGTRESRVRERTEVLFRGGSITVELQPDDRLIETPLDVPPERAWALLPAVYATLGLPVTTLIAESRLIGTQGAQAPRRVGGEPLSRAVSCGVDAFGQENADRYQVTLLMLSDVKPHDRGSLLRTLVRGSARAPGTSDAAVRCASRGRIEQRVGQLVRERAAKPPQE
jgi:hypothetical protein